MPRNSSGTYSLYTPGNPTVPSTVITTTWANNTMSDIATALTDSLSRSGNGGMSAPLQLAAGADGAPGLSWTAETTSGFYRASAGNFRYSVGGVDAYTITGSGLIIGAATGGAQGVGTINAVGVYDDGVLLANQVGANPTGTIGLTATNGVATTFMRSDATPALSQSIAPTWTALHIFGLEARASAATPIIAWNATGAAANNKVYEFYADSSGVFHFALGNDARASYADFLTVVRSANTTTSITAAGVLLAPAGSNTNPAFAFAADANTGLYNPAADDMWMALGGTGFPVGYRNIPRSTTTTTLAATDNGKMVAVSAAIAIPASVFAAGDCISIYNDSAAAVNITIAAGTLRLGGSATTGTRSLAARGIATLWFNVGGATPEVIATGSVT